MHLLKLLSFETVRRSTPKTPTVRRLRFDALEPRALLTAIDAVSAELAGSLDELASLPTNSAVAIVSVDRAEETAEVDQFESCSSESNTAPTILWFNWYADENIYTFYGGIADDGDPTLVTVYFGGIIDGASTEVFSDGSFSFAIYLEDPYGTVTAMAQDGDGLWSNQALVYV